jgi:hypothetical protein
MSHPHLRRRINDPRHDSFIDSPASFMDKCLRDQQRLIVSTLLEATRMQRHRNNEIGWWQIVERSRQEQTQVRGACRLTRILHLMDRRF